jgi:hypothetical protein
VTRPDLELQVLRASNTRTGFWKPSSPAGPSSTKVPGSLRALGHPSASGLLGRPRAVRPHRFTPEAESDRHPFAYVAFGGGPPGCVVRRLAMLEMVVVTATVLQSFSLVTEGRVVPLATGINLRPAAPMPARVIAR